MGGASFVAVSSNGGSSWLLNPSRLPFRSLGMSGDGQVIYGVFNGYDEANQQGVYRSTDGGVSWAFLKRDKGFERIGGYGFQRIMANSDGSVWYGIRRKAGLGGELLLFSSAIRSFTELNGYGTFRLIYRGGGVFGVD